eukprot:3938377-Rhodomonas_salina.7
MPLLAHPQTGSPYPGSVPHISWYCTSRSKHAHVGKESSSIIRGLNTGYRTPRAEHTRVQIAGYLGRYDGGC